MVRVLWVSFEPWETRLGAEFVARARNRQGVQGVSLLVGDVTQIDDPGFALRLRRSIQSLDLRTYFVFDQLASWQRQLSQPDRAWAEEVLSEVVRTTGFDLEGAIHSEAMFTPFERRPYFKPLSEAQILHASALMCTKIIDVFNQESPDMVGMINDQYFSKGFAAALAKSRHLELKIVRHSRVGRRYKCDNVFSHSLFNEPGNDAYRAYAKVAQVKLPAFTRGNDSIYSENLAVSGGHKDFAVLCRTRPLKALWRAGRIAGRRISDATLREWRRVGTLTVLSRVRRDRYFTAHAWRMVIFDLSVFLRTALHIMKPGKFVSHIPDRPYILVALHLRTEGSSQSGKRSEEEVIDRIASILSAENSEFQCAVLENPSAVGERRQSFYRRISAYSHVVVVDPSVDTQQLIRESAAVVTLSGTIALEASLRDVPAHAVGTPDFLSALTSQGWETLPSFVRSVVDGSAVSSVRHAVAYLDAVQETGVEMTLGWSSVSNAAVVAETVVGLEALVWRNEATRTTMRDSRG